MPTITLQSLNDREQKIRHRSRSSARVATSTSKKTRMMLIYDVVSLPTVKLYTTDSIEGKRIYDIDNMP